MAIFRENQVMGDELIELVVSRVQAKMGIDLNVPESRETIEVALVEVQKEYDLSSEDFQQEFLAGVEALAEEEGDWRDHIPYDAVMEYYENDSVRSSYENHVNECAYCQELIESLRPSDRLLGELHAVVAEKRRKETLEQDQNLVQNDGPKFRVAAVVLVAVMAGLFGWLVRGEIGGAFNDVSVATQDAIVNLPDDLSKIANLESSLDPVDRFAAARYYVAADQPHLAYQRVAEGFELTGMDTSFVSLISDAPNLEDGNLVSLWTISRELDSLNEKESISEKELLRLIQLKARIGEHKGAFLFLEQYLKDVGVEPVIIESYSSNLLDSEIEQE